MAPTPTSKSNHTNFTQIKTPSSKHRLQFNSSKITHPSPNPNSTLKENPPPEHPVEVIGRIRDYPSQNNKEQPISGVFQINPDGQTIRVRTEIGYRDFTLDGVSSSEEEDLEGFYKRFVESRITGVKMGAKCTIMMYGPTGSGKSHTMFGCSKQPGIVYRSLKEILGEEGGENDGGNGVQISTAGLFVHVTVLEIYNEEIYDLLSCEKSGGFNLWSKGGSASKVRLEMMGKKPKNATFISGNEAGKISKEIQKVEKRRIVKSTNCNDQSSRSHCMIVLDVPTVGGRLILVDMAGSENIEQAGQVGLEAKIQTAKINQGNIALKRVVESIANGDSHVPFRDSKLTMLLQDSFEDDKSKILMILCASPDPKEMHKTIFTLEYGAKAKCIIRGPHMIKNEKIGGEDSAAAVILGSKIAAMDQLILKLQMENKKREREKNEACKQLLQKEEEISQLRVKLKQVEGRVSGVSEEEINTKVTERTKTLKQELEKQLQECQRMAKEYVELEKSRMEERILQQKQEVEILRKRLEEMDLQLSHSKDTSSDDGSGDFDGSGLAKRLMEIYADEDMEKSMDLEMGDQEQCGREVKIIGGAIHKRNDTHPAIQSQPFAPSIGDRVCLSTVFEEDEIQDENENQKAQPEDKEIEKEVIEEKRVLSTRAFDSSSLGINFINEGLGSSPQSFHHENVKDAASSRKLRIQNIFTLCGNHRELSHHSTIPGSAQQKSKMGDPEFPLKNIAETNARLVPEELTHCFPESAEVKLAETQMKKSLLSDHMGPKSKENVMPVHDNADAALIEVYVKWEATKESTGKFIAKLKVVKDASLADLRKLIDIHLGMDKKEFTFLALGDPTGAPVAREKEATMPASKLPACNSQLGGYLACLRAEKSCQSPSQEVPFSPLENKLPVTPVSFPSKLDSNLGSTPYITLRRY
ncbi:hypothetical protein Nepgr_021768 [Nepenthes gracilis]|uniref:Kinesin-like protein KIN-10A n=1 Tax=Nepenthes gracilis TaxID=150966 RepID=A0AAD3SZG6_NEPGR|nr:hypothetical protein Nepgr_021768 [Nepenthes gracilis]